MTPAIAAAFRLPVLPKPEQARLAVRARRGDKSAADRLFRHSVRLIQSVANKRGRALIAMEPGLREELFAEGAIGFLKGIEHFRIGHKCSFPVFAQIWIDAHIRRYLQEKHHPIRLATTAAKRRDLYKPDALVGPEFAAARKPLLPLQAPVGPTGRIIGDSLIATDLTPEEEALRSEDGRRDHESVEDLLWPLTPRERDIVTRRYLTEGRARLATLGNERGLSRERIRQIGKAALRKMLGSTAAADDFRETYRELGRPTKERGRYGRNRRAA
jgi:RNA polymerase sigma-32 factor